MYPDCRSSFDRALSVVEMHTCWQPPASISCYLVASGPMGPWHALGFLFATQLISVFCRLRNKGPWVPCCGVVLAVRRVVRCMLGLCRMFGFISGNGFGIRCYLVRVASWTCLLPAILVPVNTLSRMLGVLAACSVTRRFSARC